MEASKFDGWRLENQLCFPLYACAKEVIRRYKPLLEAVDLTYTQYIAMSVLWERGKCTVKELGTALYLDSGTLTPVLKKLEAKGYITRTRVPSDERSLFASVTPEGARLRDRASGIPAQVAASVDLDPELAAQLRELLGRLLAALPELPG